jgi:hypothetical protein
LPYDEAFIEVLTDDGSVYSEVSSENNYPKVYNLTVEQGTDYSDNVVDIAGDTESYANFVQITNQGSSSVRVRINGLSGATFELGGSETQVFNAGDLLVTKLNFINNVSGGTAADVQVLCSIKSNCLS